MPKINIQSTSNEDAEAIYAKVKDFLENLDDIKSLDPSMKLSFDDAQKKGSAKGQAFSAELSVKEKSPGCLVDLEVDLPGKFALMKGMIKKQLQSKLDKALA
jgi:hypothetical protein